VVELTLLALAAAIAAAEGHVRRAVALSEAAVALKDRLGRDDAALLEWYWERLVPAYEALTAAELAEARTHAAELSVEGALAYAAAAEG